jgi:hypothetical protein
MGRLPGRLTLQRKLIWSGWKRFAGVWDCDCFFPSVILMGGRQTMARRARPKTAGGGTRPFFVFRATGPVTSVQMELVFESQPGVIVRGIHRKIIPVINGKAKSIMLQEVKKKFKAYSDSDRRINGRRKRWQTPTLALNNSIGVKMVSQRQMRNKLVVVGLVGPRWDFKATKAVKKRIGRITEFGLKRAPKKIHVPKGPKGATIRPARYAHLANFGHRKGRGPLRADPHDYMTPTNRRVSAIMPGIVERMWQPLYLQVVGKDTANRVKSLKRSTVTYS